jgi:hypothetical protein
MMNNRGKHKWKIMKKREKTMKNDEKERTKQWTMMKNSGKMRNMMKNWGKNNEKWWKRVNKNNETWW